MKHAKTTFSAAVHNFANAILALLPSLDLMGTPLEFAAQVISKQVEFLRTTTTTAAAAQCRVFLAERWREVLDGVNMSQLADLDADLVAAAIRTFQELSHVTPDDLVGDARKQADALEQDITAYFAVDLKVDEVADVMRSGPCDPYAAAAVVLFLDDGGDVADLLDVIGDRPSLAALLDSYRPHAEFSIGEAVDVLDALKDVEGVEDLGLLQVANILADAHGVEPMTIDHDGDDSGRYINMGDSYDVTLLENEAGDITVGNWADYVEMCRRYADADNTADLLDDLQIMDPFSSDVVRLCDFGDLDGDGEVAVALLDLDGVDDMSIAVWRSHTIVYLGHGFRPGAAMSSDGDAAMSSAIAFACDALGDDYDALGLYQCGGDRLPDTIVFDAPMVLCAAGEFPDAVEIAVSLRIAQELEGIQDALCDGELRTYGDALDENQLDDVIRAHNRTPFAPEVVAAAVAALDGYAADGLRVAINADGALVVEYVDDPNTGDLF